MRTVVFSLQLGLLFATELARAQPVETQPLGATLEWTTTEGCIDRDTLIRGIEATLGAALFASDGSEAAIAVRGEILRDRDPTGAPEFRANVFVDDGREERHRELVVRGDDCTRLDDSMVVVLAMLLDEARSAHEAARASPDPTSLRLSEEPLRAPSQGESIDFGIRLGGRVRYDILPGAGFGPGIEAEIGYGIVTVFAGLWIWPAVTATGDDGAGGRFSGWTTELGFCMRGTPLEWLELGGCISGELGDVVAIGIGLDHSVNTTQLHVAVDGRLFGRILVAEALALYGALGVSAPILRPPYRFFEGDGERTVFQAAPLAPDVLLGIELRTP